MKLYNIEKYSTTIPIEFHVYSHETCFHNCTISSFRSDKHLYPEAFENPPPKYSAEGMLKILLDPKIDTSKVCSSWPLSVPVLLRMFRNSSILMMYAKTFSESGTIQGLIQFFSRPGSQTIMSVLNAVWQSVLSKKTAQSNCICFRYGTIIIILHN